MHSVTFILHQQVFAISTPCSATARTLQWVLLCAGVRARMWSHRVKNAPRLIS